MARGRTFLSQCPSTYLTCAPGLTTLRILTRADATLFMWAVDADHVACVALLPPQADVQCPCGAFAVRGHATGAEIPQAPVVRVIDWQAL